MSTDGSGPPDETAHRDVIDSAAEPPGRIRPGRHIGWWAAPVLVTILFLVVQPLIGAGWALFPDSYRYAKQAERILGADAEQAHLTALEAFCGSRADYAFHAGGTFSAWTARSLPPAGRSDAVTACLDTYGPVGDVTTLDPRYQSIFTTRPGYPLLAAPFIAAFGIADGMRTLGFVIAAAGGLVTYAALRYAGVSATGSTIGQAAYLASPLGWWALQGLGEGLVDLCVLCAAMGVVIIARGRTRAGLVTMAAAWLALGITRFSSLLLIAAAVAAACTVLALFVCRDRRGPLLAAAGISAAATALTLLAMPVLGLPGAAVTLQDTFTHHFADPLVADPWHRLLDMNAGFWPTWLSTPSASWPVLAGTLVGAGALAIRRRDLLWPALALFGAGVAQVAAHPLPQEADRLGLLMWIPATVGVAVIAQAAIEWTRRHGATAPR